MIMDNKTEFNEIENLMHGFLLINIVYIVNTVLGFFGNILIVSTILKNKYLRTPMNVSLVSLALCDLIVCTCVLPVRLFLYNGTWDAPYSLVLCRVDVFMKSVCDYAQPSMLVATSYERYKSIAKPFQSRTKMKRTVIVITATWGTCLCCGAVSAIFFKDGATIFPCNRNIIHVQMSTYVLNYREAYVTFPLGFSCIVLVCIFYILMIRTLHEHTNKMKRQFKSKPFKNKVHPESKPEQNVKKETQLDTVAIQPLVDEKNNANTSDNSRQTSGTSVRTSDGFKNSTEALHAKEKNDQLLHASDAARNDQLEITTDSHSEVKDICACTMPRRISIRKTRDNIHLPGTDKKEARFSTIAKHVVILKAYKKKSLSNIQIRKSQATSVHKHTSESLDGQESKKHKQEHKTDKQSNETDFRNDGETKTFRSGSLCVSTSTIKKNDAGNESVNIESVKYANSTVTLPDVNEPNGQVSHITAEHSTNNISNKATKICVEPSLLNSKDGSDREISPEKLNISESKVENTVTESSRICNKSKSDDENNDKELPGRSDTTKNEDIGALPKNSEIVSNNNGSQSDKTDSSCVKNKISNVDIVDFYGTVHKDVKVEGAVVGAVCVMNTTNRLEGRRKVEMRAAKRIAVMMGSFVLLWLPLPLIVLFVSSRRQISTSDIEALLTSASISSTTIAFNPILNLLLNKQLRSASLTLLRRAVNALKRIRLR